MELQERSKLEYLTKRAGLGFQVYCPYDGAALKYRFFRATSMYDKPEEVLFTAPNLDEALAFISGVNISLEEARRRIMKELDIE